MQQGKLFVLSGPSGVGKGTILTRLFVDFQDIEYSVSATTRQARAGEVQGENYYFMSEEEFFQLVENDQLIEWANVHNNYYGTPKEYVDKTLKKGQDIILEIDIQGAKQVRENYPDAVFIFLLPPSLQELEQRLEQRGSEDKRNKKIRLRNAREEMQEKQKYDYVIINDRIEETVDQLRSIIIAESCRIDKEDDN